MGEERSTASVRRLAMWRVAADQESCSRRGWRKKPGSTGLAWCDLGGIHSQVWGDPNTHRTLQRQRGKLRRALIVGPMRNPRVLIEQHSGTSSLQGTTSCNSLLRSSPLQPEVHLQPSSLPAGGTKPAYSAVSQLPLQPHLLRSPPPPTTSPFPRAAHLFQGETDGICLVFACCQGVRSEGLIYLQGCTCESKCVCVSRSCLHKQLRLPEGSTLSFFLGGRQTERNQALRVFPVLLPASPAKRAPARAGFLKALRWERGAYSHPGSKPHSPAQP